MLPVQIVVVAVYLPLDQRRPDSGGAFRWLSTTRQVTRGKLAMEGKSLDLHLPGHVALEISAYVS